MADYQFHSTDCPLWHPEKFVAGAAGACTSKCWCQRWSNLVDWNVQGMDAAAGDPDALVGVKKDAFSDKVKHAPNPTPLQTDAFLGSNLWSMEEMKFDQEAGNDLDMLWKKLDAASDSLENLTVETKPSPTSMAHSPASLSPPSSALFNSNSGFALNVSNVGSCLDNLGISLSPDCMDVSRSPLGMDPSALFDDSALLGLPSPTMPSGSVPSDGSIMVEKKPVLQESAAVSEQPAPKRRGRPPGKTNKNKEPKRPRKRSPSLTESIMSDSFDPTAFVISPDDLKPIPVVKKSKKKPTPEEAKDDKYWARRKKNNMAAKRSRDIRRLKENQIAVRAAFLEKEHLRMKTELEQLRAENEILLRKLEAYEALAKNKTLTVLELEAGSR